MADETKDFIFHLCFPAVFVGVAVGIYLLW